jgi:hypothetical protein
MRIDVRASADWPDASVALARTRLAFTLGRFAGRVRSLTVRLTDVNRPGDGRGKQCLIAVRLARPRRVIVIEDVDPDHDVVVSRAADRTSRAVLRAVQSARGWGPAIGP